MKKVTICDCGYIIKSCIDSNTKESQEFKNIIKSIDVDPSDYYYCLSCKQMYIFKKVNIEQNIKESKLTNFGLEDPLNGVSKNGLIQKNKGKNK